MLTEASSGLYCSAASGIYGKKQNLVQRPRAQNHSHSLTSWAPSPYPPQVLSNCWYPDPHITADFFTPLPGLPAFTLILDPSLTISDGASHSLRDLGGFPIMSGVELQLAFRALVVWLQPPLQLHLSFPWINNVQATSGTFLSPAHSSGSLPLGLFVQSSACQGLLPPLHWKLTHFSRPSINATSSMKFSSNPPDGINPLYVTYPIVALFLY